MYDITTKIVLQWYLLTKLQLIISLIILQVLGSGSYGTVFSIRMKNADITRAVKMIPKSRIYNREEFLNEVNILKTLVKKLIIKLLIHSL